MRREDSFAGARRDHVYEPEKVLVGMSVDVNIRVEEIPAATPVPRESVGGIGAHAFVLVIADGVAARRDVDIDDWPATLVVVRAGLKPGELVAVDPKGAVAGAHVRAKVMPCGL